MAKYSRSNRLEADNPNTIEPIRSSKLTPQRLSCDEESEYGLHADQRNNLNRRNAVWRAFLYGNFHPRRRFSRRVADNHQFLFDWHEPRILYLALCVLLLSCTDALFTLNLLQAGASEANAVMASMLDGGIDRFLTVKIGITSLSLLILAALARRKFFKSFSVEHLLKVFCVGYIMVIYYQVYLFRYVFEVGFFSSTLYAS